MKAAILKAAIFLMALSCLVQQDQAAFVETVYTTTLSGAQEVPQAGSPFNSGTAVCIYDRNAQPKLLDCEVQHSVDSPISAGIYVGETGTLGPEAYSFSVLLSKNIRQVFQLKDLVGYTVAQQEDDFLNGRWYINILSDEYKKGDIRGQLGHSDRVFSRMSYLQTIPRASGTTAHGIGLGTYSFNTPNRQLALDVVHDVQSPTSADVHKGKIGEVGPQLYSLKVSASPSFAHFEYTLQEQVDFLKDQHYFQIKSTTNPFGEIRGQLMTIDYIESVAFTSRLDSDQTIPNSDSDATGCGLITFNCETNIMEYLVFHNVENPTGAYVNSGREEKTGPIRFALSRSQSPIYGFIELGLEEIYLLYTDQLYFNILSSDASSGEIRGQITTDYEFWTYLSGTNVVPPTTTSSVGCATFRLVGDTNPPRILDYDIHHSVSDSNSAEIFVGNEGENGFSTLLFSSTASPISGQDYAFDDDELFDLLDEDLYLQIASSRFPGGEVRGQLKRINPCTYDKDNILTIASSVNLPSAPQASFSYNFSPDSNSRTTYETNSQGTNSQGTNSQGTNSQGTNSQDTNSITPSTVIDIITPGNSPLDRFTTGYFDAPGTLILDSTGRFTFSNGFDAPVPISFSNIQRNDGERLVSNFVLIFSLLVMLVLA